MDANEDAFIPFRKPKVDSTHWSITLSRRDHYAALEIDVMTGRISRLDIGDLAPQDVLPRLVAYQTEAFATCKQLRIAAGLEKA